MPGRFRLALLTAIVGIPQVCQGAQAESRRVLKQQPVVQTASLHAGWIEGTVTDERQQPVEGAAVTAQGRDLLLAETDGAGRFAMRGVPAGLYLLKVQGRGYNASRREFVNVVSARGTRHVVRLRRVAPGAVPDPRILAAGVSLGEVTASTAWQPGQPRTTTSTPEDALVPVEEEDAHDHSALGWRLRHAKRSVLRDTTERFLEGAASDESFDDRHRFDVSEWAFSLGRSTGSLLANGALTGRVQLLTSSAFDRPLELFAAEEVPAGIAYVNFGGPVGARTSWSVESAFTQGDVSSWFVAGSYALVLADTHGVNVRSSYSRQRYEGANAAALAEFDGGSRNVGGVEVFDRWTLSSRALVTYGGRYEHYDYLPSEALFSPSITVALSPAQGTWVRATVGQEMTAPGAEEFVPQAYGTLALPPTRTFAPLVPGASLASERTRYLSVGLERDVGPVLVGVHHFRQNVEDQLATIFGLEMPDGSPRDDLGHYAVANAGSFGAEGWIVSVGRSVASRVRGSIEYRVARADWVAAGDVDALGRWAPSAIPTGQPQRLHDLTTRIDADIPETSTRVLATCRLNNGYARDDIVEPEPQAETRFDVQVYQGLPFLGFTRANWELVFAVRNLFHDPNVGTASVYDELLVVRPPKRVVGGITVQF
jgi:Carboxypeptidase regulatory-like domain/TonB dependent receptor